MTERVLSVLGYREADFTVEAGAQLATKHVVTVVIRYNRLFRRHEVIAERLARFAVVLKRRITEAFWHGSVNLGRDDGWFCFLCKDVVMRQLCAELGISIINAVVERIVQQSNRRVPRMVTV